MDKIKLESDIDDLKLLNAMVSDAWRKQLPIGSGLIERLLSAMDVTYKNYKDAIPNLKTVEEIFGEMKKRPSTTREDVIDNLTKWREHPVHNNAINLLDYYKDQLKTLR